MSAINFDRATECRRKCCSDLAACSVLSPQNPRFL